MIYIGKFNVTVRDKNGKVLTLEELKEKVNDNEQYYMIMDLIRKRINDFRQVTNN